MKLYFAPRSRAVRTAWLLYEMDLDFELARYELLDSAMRAPEFLAVSPNGRVPVLEDGDVRIFESGAIAQYLSARYGNGRFEPAPTSPHFPGFLQWLHYGEGMIMGPMNNYMVETFFLPSDRKSVTHEKRAFKLMTKAVSAIDAHLKDREFLAGDFSVADTITGHACISCDMLGVDFSDLPHLRAYVDRLVGRDAYQRALAL